MRIISKILTGSAIAAAALAVSACGSKTETNIDNTTVTDLNASDDMGTMTDNMTAVDGAGNGDMGAMANDTTATDAMSNDAMAANTTNAM